MSGRLVHVLVSGSKISAPATALKPSPNPPALHNLPLITKLYRSNRCVGASLIVTNEAGNLTLLGDCWGAAAATACAGGWLAAMSSSSSIAEENSCRGSSGSNAIEYNSS